MRGSYESSSVPVIAVVGLFCILKFGMAIALLAGNSGVFLSGDGQEYATLAETWYRVGTYARSVDAAPEIFRLPGYSAFLLLAQPLDEAHRYAIVSMAQVVLLHVWLLLVGRWIQRRFGVASALVFITLLSLTITWIHYPATIHADFQFAVLEFTGLVFSLEAARATHGRPVLLVSSALCWMGAVLTRPDLAVFPAWLLVAVTASAIWNRWRPRRRVDVGGQIVVLVAVSATILLWAARNFLASGRFTYTAVFDYAVDLFAGGQLKPGAAVEGPRTDIALVDIVLGMARHVRTLVGESIPALVKIFVSPGRWYLHRYAEVLGIPLETGAVPFFAAQEAGLPPIEMGYIGFNVGVSLLVGATLLLFLWRLGRGTVAAPSEWIAMTVWVLLYFLLQKAAWGAFDPGNGPRYAMSMYPFIVFLGALAVARPRWRESDQHGTSGGEEVSKPPANR